MTLKFFRVLGLLAGASGLFGCTTSSTSLDDCYDICDRYRSCFDSKYNTSDCYHRCRDASGGRYFSSDTEDCRSCFLNRSCNSADYTCGPRCDWIVP